jgi:ribosomal protein S1
MKVGEIVNAKVDQVEQYGVYVSYCSDRLFIQIPELDWVRRIPDAREFTCVGDVYDVLVLAVDERRKLYSGSIKQAHPELDPYKKDGTYDIGTIHQGKAVLNTEYGTFVEIVPGLEALIYDKNGGNIEIGSKVSIKVLIYDIVKRHTQVELVN